MKQLYIALRSYEDLHGTLPPRAIVDSRGVSVHSWRVLLLPVLGYQKLYDEYRFDERWDGPNNTKLASSVVDAYRCPLESGKGGVSYFAVGTGSPDGDRAPTHGANWHATVLLVEIVGTNVSWLEPWDIELLDDDERGALPGGLGPRSRHGTEKWTLFGGVSQGAHILHKTGEVRYVRTGKSASGTLKEGAALGSGLDF